MRRQATYRRVAVLTGFRRALTLIEVLIVVVVMGIIAAVVLPRIKSTSDDAKHSTLEHNMAVLRSQIELYYFAHNNQYPQIIDNDLPQLTNPTNVRGQIGPGGPEFPLGPYVVGELPPNPFDNSRKVSPVAQPGQKPAAPVGSLGGWQYDATTGNIWPNHGEYYR